MPAFYSIVYVHWNFTGNFSDHYSWYFNFIVVIILTLFYTLKKHHISLHTVMMLELMQRK
jgi:hypothetical protein